MPWKDEKTKLMALHAVESAHVEGRLTRGSPYSEKARTGCALLQILFASHGSVNAYSKRYGIAGDLWLNDTCGFTRTEYDKIIATNDRQGGDAVLAYMKEIPVSTPEVLA